MSTQTAQSRSRRRLRRAPLTIASRRAQSSRAPAPKVPAAPPAPKLQTFQPGSLAHKVQALRLISHYIESIILGLSLGLFATYTSQRDAIARVTYLRNRYKHLRSEIDLDLSGSNHLHGSNVPVIPPQTDASRPIKNPIPAQTPHKYRHGPTSPHYTVDKALKRKAESASIPSASGRAPKKRKFSAESDFVETDYESEHKSVVEAQSGAGATTNLGAIPLRKKENDRIESWTWKAAIGKVDLRRKRRVAEEVVSPLGTTRWPW